MSGRAKVGQDKARGKVRLVYRKETGTLTYVQKGANQSAVDRDGVSLDTYIHTIYGLLRQRPARTILMIGCGGGLLGKMLSALGHQVMVVDINPESFALAKRHFGLPDEVRCHVGDGLAFMQRTRRRFDALIIDAFIGEDIPAHMTGDAFCRAARRCLKAEGAMFVNVCLNDRADLTADRFAERLRVHGWQVRLLDQRGGPRNAVVMAGNVKGLQRPKLIHLPRVDVARIKREWRGLHFRPWHSRQKIT